MLSTLVVFIGIVNLFSGLTIIFLVLMQQGKGADAGANFGGGSSQGLFGAAGAANFLSRSTAVAATIFFSTCLILAYAAAKQGTVVGGADSLHASSVAESKQAAPVSPATLPDSSKLSSGGQKQSGMQDRAVQDSNTEKVTSTQTALPRKKKVSDSHTSNVQEYHKLATKK